MRRSLPVLRQLLRRLLGERGDQAVAPVALLLIAAVGRDGVVISCLLDHSFGRPAEPASR